jgi:adenylate cyclase
MGWSTDIDQENLEAEAWTRRALQLDPRDSFVLGRAGCVLSHVLRKLEESSSLLDRALELDSNDAFAWKYSGWTHEWLGHPEEAVRRFEIGLRLNPLDPNISVTSTGIASAHFSMSRYPEAEMWAKKALQEQPNAPNALRTLIAIQALAGNIEQAKASLATYLRIDPLARTSTMRRRFYPGISEWFDKFLNGFRLAGLPE